MALSTLEQVVDRGLKDVPGDQLWELSGACEEECESKSDARFCIIAMMLRDVARWWLDENEGAVPVALSDEIDNILMDQLPAVLAASPGDAGGLAVRMRSEVKKKLLPSSDWPA